MQRLCIAQGVLSHTIHCGDVLLAEGHLAVHHVVTCSLQQLAARILTPCMPGVNCSCRHGRMQFIALLRCFARAGAVAVAACNFGVRTWL